MSYNTVILGNENPIQAIETLIVWILRKIMSMDRTELIQQNIISNQITTLLQYEKSVYKLNREKLNKRWGGVINWVYRDVEF
jgi:hypothetical protein